MSDSLVSYSAKTLRQRALGKGGFANTDQGDYRSDATAWAILALVAAGDGNDKELLSLARTRLAAGQLSDGRVSLSPEHPEVYWPTPLAILAWHQAPAHQAELSRAANFLLKSSGRHWQTPPEEVVKLDNTLRGWPWVDATSSWVAPTALGIMALKTAGYGNQPRVAEAQRLLLDRECLHGGWNYGNRSVFGAELRPMPEDTGMALDALQDATSRSSLEPSLAYLKSAVKILRTPVALAWSLLGLGAWGERPAAAPAWLSECLTRQERYGVYDTTSLSLLILASRSSGGLEKIFNPDPALPQG
ncbi:MAG: hypothetical protein NTY36_01205 [Deltaproteobacteria bacterium]|nr:hypothetical protein [Deltaproteobacteria bacterium]